jgi:hypothetical protein
MFVRRYSLSNNLKPHVLRAVIVRSVYAFTLLLKTAQDCNSSTLGGEIMRNRRAALAASMVDFSKALTERLRREEIEVSVSVGTIDVPEGHLAVILTLSSSNSLFDQRQRADSIAKEECVKYLQDSGKAVE